LAVITSSTCDVYLNIRYIHAFVQNAALTHIQRSILQNHNIENPA